MIKFVDSERAKKKLLKKKMRDKEFNQLQKKNNFSVNKFVIEIRDK
jgi:hypothetical protein